mmetsp:Transcript_16847/g.32284  ORF Transcript_16847/g.32284 Transcript_16847/m.32284 type:complete len:221 (-) Transcript_16847:984-1646(-)
MLACVMSADVGSYPLRYRIADGASTCKPHCFIIRWKSPRKALSDPSGPSRGLVTRSCFSSTTMAQRLSCAGSYSLQFCRFQAPPSGSKFLRELERGSLYVTMGGGSTRACTSSILGFILSPNLATKGSVWMLAFCIISSTALMRSAGSLAACRMMADVCDGSSLLRRCPALITHTSMGRQLGLFLVPTLSSGSLGYLRVFLYRFLKYSATLMVFPSQSNL